MLVLSPCTDYPDQPKWGRLGIYHKRYICLCGHGTFYGIAGTEPEQRECANCGVIHIRGQNGVSYKAPAVTPDQQAKNAAILEARCGNIKGK